MFFKSLKLKGIVIIGFLGQGPNSFSNETLSCDALDLHTKLSTASSILAGADGCLASAASRRNGDLVAAEWSRLFCPSDPNHKLSSPLSLAPSTCEAQ